MGTANNFMLQRSRSVSRLRPSAAGVWTAEEQQATGGGHKQVKRRQHADAAVQGLARWTRRETGTKELLCL